ncbi:MAG TPA: hypothetical protein VFL57_09230 [Bryobacteraceae bacterium]|nr:hypothetical protein [Bryobacteraceae bacterium]
MTLDRRFFAVLALVAGVVFAAGYGVKPGRYLGSWQGSSAGGKLDITITGTEGQPLSAEVVFTYQDQRVTTKLREFKTAGAAIEIVYDYELGGSLLRSALKGEVKDKKIAGTYAATVANTGDSVDQGTWEVSRE